MTTLISEEEITKTIFDETYVKYLNRKQGGEGDICLPYSSQHK